MRHASSLGEVFSILLKFSRYFAQLQKTRFASLTRLAESAKKSRDISSLRIPLLYFLFAFSSKISQFFRLWGAFSPHLRSKMHKFSILYIICTVFAYLCIFSRCGFPTTVNFVRFLHFYLIQTPLELKTYVLLPIFCVPVSIFPDDVLK